MVVVALSFEEGDWDGRTGRVQAWCHGDGVIDAGRWWDDRVTTEVGKDEARASK